MMFLKEDTATTISLGPFVDGTDGFSYEAGMAAAMNHATTGIRISKNGAALAARTTLTLPVYDAFGYYTVDLDATDVGTPGRLKVIFGDAAVCRPVEAEFMIVCANVYDSMFGDGTTYLKTDLTQILEGPMTGSTGTQVADSFKYLFDVATPVLTAESVNQTGDAYTPAAAVDTLSKAGGEGDLAAILTDTGTTLDTIVDSLTTELAKVPKSDSTVSLNATVLTAIGAAVKTAMEAAAGNLNDVFNRVCGKKLVVNRTNETIATYDNAGTAARHVYTRVTAGVVDTYTRTDG